MRLAGGVCVFPVTCLAEERLSIKQSCAGLNPPQRGREISRNPEPRREGRAGSGSRAGVISGNGVLTPQTATVKQPRTGTNLAAFLSLADEPDPALSGAVPAHRSELG